MNAKERTDYVYSATAEMIQFIDPHSAVMIEAKDAYGVQISFTGDDTLENKLQALISDRGFQLIDGEESIIYSKNIEEYGATVIISKSKSNAKVNLSVTA